jgi:hypothetical protein
MRLAVADVKQLTWVERALSYTGMRYIRFCGGIHAFPVRQVA